MINQVCPHPGSRAYTIEPELTKLRQKIHALWGTPFIATRNPCPQPVSLERRDLLKLCEAQYFVADKTDGVRYLLLLTKLDGRNVAFFVDRSMNFYQTIVAAKQTFFHDRGTLLDGELAWHKPLHDSVDRRLVYLVFDVVCCANESLINHPYVERLQKIRGIVDLAGAEIRSADEASTAAKKGKIISGGTPHSMFFAPKQCLELSMISTLLRQFPQMPYATDGLIITRNELPVQSGRAKCIFKWKMRHTIDLLVDEGVLYMGKGVNRLEFFNGIKGYSFQFPVVDIENIAGRVVAEFAISVENKTVALSLDRIRSDKGHPNSEFTIQRTVQDAEDAISVEEVVHAARGRETTTIIDEPEP